ncbi:MAG: shikimate dehydrogenase [Candidatus Methanomethyliaceae archaeon]|nr:shikimate dehydrogenase [Candidatus Methanomethyliaceae archaeon]MDW7970566.1 shikimate dehydrogenase [Nitrososphaerota archaeon]
MTTAKTRLCCLIGDPIEHSLSPIMFTAAFSELKEDAVYLAFKVKKEDLKNAIDGLRAIGFLGCNVTMPHKIEVTKYLDKLEDTAKFVGSVNTIAERGGKLIGYNTDGKGVIASFENEGIEIHDKKVLIVGYGGAARSIAFEIVEKKPSEVIIAGRDASKAKMLVDLIKGRVNAYEILMGDLKKIGADIIINATPLGMRQRIEEIPIPEELLKKDVVVLDLVYDPIETKLLQLAKEKGCKIIDGLEPLVHQGAIAFKIWIGKDAPINIMRKAIREAIL